jgi:CPA2 family monovalent cation:H+ antiporter-2
MHTATFLQDLAVVMIVAGLVTVLFHRFKQPVVLGYIVAGVIVGPHTPPYQLIHEEAAINTLAELGVILLMFSLGLEFSLRKLKQVGSTAFIAAFLEIILMVWVGYEIGQAFGWNSMDSLFLGATLSISSTTIIVKTLTDLGKVKEPFAQLAFGILVIEDILGIAMIALLSGIAASGRLQWSEMGFTLGKLGIFLVVTLVVSLLLVPRLLHYVARFKSDEMLLVAVLGLCFGYSLLAARLGYSVALGAFLIGAVIAESREKHRIEGLILPIREMFSAIFFVAIGLLIDPAVLLEHWGPVLAITVAVIAGKVLSCSFGVFVSGNDTRTSLRVGMGLAQIGEFSFIIASLGMSLNVTSKFLYPIAVAVSAITTLTTPYLIKSTDRAVGLFEHRAPQTLVQAMEFYTKWVSQFRVQHPGGERARLRTYLLQIAINLIFITAIFMGVAFLLQSNPEWLQRWASAGDWLKAGAWLAAVILSQPMLIASSSRLKALGLAVADVRLQDGSATAQAASLKRFIARVIHLGGAVLMGLYLILLSSAFLPTLKVFLLLLVVSAAIAAFFQQWFTRVYANAEAALEETLTESDTASHAGEKPSTELPAMLQGVALGKVKISPGAAAAGQLISQLQLRTRTGASIIGIERAKGRIVNPHADEELQAGDDLLLLGDETQLAAATRLLQREGKEVSQATGSQLTID